MNAVRKNTSTERLLASLELEVASEAPIEEVNKELKLMGADPEKVIANIHKKVSFLQENAKIARSIDLDPVRVKHRLLMIGLIGLFGFLGACAAAYSVVSGRVYEEPAWLLASTPMLGFVAILLGALAAFANVLWSAFIYQAVLAKAAQREVDVVTQALQDLYRRNPSIAALIQKHLEQCLPFKTPPPVDRPC